MKLQTICKIRKKKVSKGFSKEKTALSAVCYASIAKQMKPKLTKHFSRVIYIFLADLLSTHFSPQQDLLFWQSYQRWFLVPLKINQAFN